MSFLLRLDQTVYLTDVRYGPYSREPGAVNAPDFEFQLSRSKIGVELTALNPSQLLEQGQSTGNKAFARFKDWNENVRAANEGLHEFSWGVFSARESIQSLEYQFRDKVRKAGPWKSNYDQRWLLMDISSGGPFAPLVVSNARQRWEGDASLLDYHDKVLSEVASVLCEPSPFEHAFLFSGCDFLMFSGHQRSPLVLRGPNPHWIARGAELPDEILNRKSEHRTQINRNCDLTSERYVAIIQKN